MTRELVGDAPSVRTRAALERLPDAPVELAPPAEGEPLVGRVAQQAVAEAKAAFAVGHEEPVESSDHRLGVGLVELQRGDETRPRETGTEHRGASQHGAVGAAQLVDLHGHQRLDRLGKRVEFGAALQRGDHLGDEQRASGRARGDRFGDVPGERGVLGQLLDEEEGCVRRQRREGHLERLDAVRHPESTFVGASRHDDEPAALADAPRDAPDQLDGGLVHEVHVVDDDECGIGDEPVEQRLDGLRDPFRHEALVEGGRLGGRRQVEPEDEAEQRQPRLEPGCDGGDRTAQPPFDLTTGGVRPELQRPPDDLPDGHVRLVRVNLSALDPHRAPSRHVSAQLAEQTGLPEARVTRDDHERPLAPGARS